MRKQTIEREMLTEEEITSLKALYETVKGGKAEEQDITGPNELKKLDDNLQQLKDELNIKSRTAKLWLQYSDYVKVTKDAISAERTGNWSPISL